MGEKKTFYVEVPIVVKLMVGIDAENKQDAIEKVFNSDLTLDITQEENAENKLDYIDYEWEMHKKIVQGNFFLGAINEAYAEEEDV